MLRYNTQLKTLVLPEYGRNIQDMVDHCLTINDRDERTQCAYTIVATMATFFPELKNGSEYDHKLWDHLAIMSDFKLDIDYPCDIIQSDSLHTRPEKIAYSTDAHRAHSQYGHVINDMIRHAVSMEEGEERDELVLMIANQMKKIMVCDNNENPDDSKIFNDLSVLSHGVFRLNLDNTRLRQYVPIAQPTSKKKKKK